jgi:hypothetical protein
VDDIPKNIAVFFEVHKITTRGVSFCGHNSNTEFSRVLRRGEKYLITILVGRVGGDIAGIGCVAHIVRSCAQSTRDELVSIKV